MAKNFSPRVSKKERKLVEFEDKLYRNFDEKLLEGAKLEELKIQDIKVRDQVRTKFNEASIRELAKNIEANGLIQPLVVHKEGKHFVLICGERRFRAISTIPSMEKAPCFVLENKSSQELMAIQFSENSSREALHYIDKADGVYNYQQATKASERKICEALGISKTEVHRALIIAKLPTEIKEAAKLHNIEKYVLLEFNGIDDSSLRNKISRQIVIGEVTKRTDFRKLVKHGGVVNASKIVKNAKSTKKSKSIPAGLTANALVKVMEHKAKQLDPEARQLLEKLMKEAQDIIS